MLMDLLKDISIRSKHFGWKVIHNQDCESHTEIMWMQKWAENHWKFKGDQFSLKGKTMEKERCIYCVYVCGCKGRSFHLYFSPWIFLFFLNWLICKRGCSSIINATDKNGEKEKKKNKGKTRILYCSNRAHPSANQYSLGLVVQLIMIHPTALSSSPYFSILSGYHEETLSKTLHVRHLPHFSFSLAKNTIQWAGPEFFSVNSWLLPVSIASLYKSS